MTDKAKKGEDGNADIWISRERKELFRSGLSFGEKVKNSGHKL